MRWKRRTLLGGIASASVPLAGCSLGDGSDGSDGGSGDGGFEEVRVEGRSLVVGLGGLSASTVNVIAPDGTTFGSTDVATGATTVEFDIGLSYAPGEYRVVASADGSAVAETALTIAPDLEITEFGTGASYPEQMPNELNFSEEQALVEVSNEGTGPQAVEKLLFLGGFPNPTKELAQESTDTSGIFDTNDGFGDQEFSVIPAGETTFLYSTSKPFLFAGDGIQCEQNPQTGECDIILRTGIGSGSVSAEYLIEYSASDSRDDCDISISKQTD